MPRRIQPKPAVELMPVSLKLPADLVRRVDAYAKFLGGTTDRTHVVTQALEIALDNDPEFRKAGSKPAATPSARVA
jgi:hypothetical protein